MLYKTVIILISGKIGSGKSTFANFLLDALTSKGYKSRIIPFAQQVKGIANSMGWDGEKDEKGRILLQEIGTAGRNYDPNTWVNWVLNIISNSREPLDFVIIDDWRYLNEKEVISSKKYYDLITARVIGRGSSNVHESEHGLPEGLSVDYLIINPEESTLKNMRKTAGEVANEILSKYSKGDDDE